MDKTTLNQLKRFSAAFKEARDRGANESDTVMFLVKFFEDVLGWDSFKGEISKETAVKDRFCDIALKTDGQTRLLVECKGAGLATLVAKHIEQAENYASRAGLTWVILTNGVEWQLYHLAFAETEGIQHDLAFRANLIDDLETDPECLWEKLSLLSKKSILKGDIEEFWVRQKALSKGAIVRALFTEDVLLTVRRELNRSASARLEMDDVFGALRDVLSKEAILEAGEIGIQKRRKRRRKIAKLNAAGQVEEVEEDVPEVEAPKVTPIQTV